MFFFFNLARLAPQAITFPPFNQDEWSEGNRKTAATGISVEKLVSHDLFALAPDVEELVRRFLGIKDSMAPHFAFPKKAPHSKKPKMLNAGVVGVRTKALFDDVFVRIRDRS